MSFPLLYIILSLLATHTCKACCRVDKEVVKQVQVDKKNVDPMKFIHKSETLTPLKVKPHSSEEHQGAANAGGQTKLDSGEIRGDNTSLGAQIGSLVVSTTRNAVDRQKRRRKRPGFNIDYAPPRTHPPANN